MQLLTTKKRLLTGAASALALAMTPSVACAQEQQITIEAQPLSEALIEFSEQTGVTVAAPSEAIAGKQARRVSGNLEPEKALRQMLRGTGLRLEVTPSGGYVIRQGGGQALLIDQESEADENVIVVTGTNIRGIAPDSSPTRTYTREDIARSGAATAQEFIARLPENFGGGSNPNVPAGLANDTAAGANSGGFGSYGASVNLRGLGSGSTLVLLNGNRVAPSSIIGDFVDISMIPATAIDRIETLTDGASSIYGSDAVAGVVNFILRDDFDGFEGSVRLGTGTEGGAPDQIRLSATGGKTWGSGGILAVFEHFDQDELLVEDRDFALNDFSPSYLLPSQQRNSFLAVLNQDISESINISVNGLYSERESSQLRTDFTGNTFQYEADTEVLNFSGHGTAFLGSDWFVDLFGQYGTVGTVNETTSSLIGSGRTETTRTSNTKVWSADTRLSGPLLSLPAGDVRVALGAHYRDEELSSSGVTLNPIPVFAQRDVYAFYGEAFIPIIAPENDIPIINRLEFNISGRFADYSDFGETFDPKVGILYSPGDGLNIRGSYSTSFKAPPLGLVGAQDFGASLLPTSLLFSIFNLTPADPSLADVVQLTIAGTDNDLKPETSRAFTAGFDFSQDWGNNRITASATWFDINFQDRLGSIPIPGNVIHFDAINLAFDDPNVFPAGSFTFNPSRDEIDAVLASLETPIGNPFGLDPYDTFFISRLLIVTNTSKSVARGVDFRLAYTRQLTEGDLQLALDGTYLSDFERQATATTPVVENIGTVFNPVDLKMRGTLAYAGKNLSGALFINYVDSYKTDNTPNAVPIDSWTTLDLSLTFDTKDNLGSGILRNTALRLSVINLFDQDPPGLPLFADSGVDGYDPTNASPLGRFVSLELIKRF